MAVTMVISQNETQHPDLTLLHKLFNLFKSTYIYAEQQGFFKQYILYTEANILFFPKTSPVIHHVACSFFLSLGSLHET